MSVEDRGPSGVRGDGSSGRTRGRDGWMWPARGAGGQGRLAREVGRVRQSSYRIGQSRRVSPCFAGPWRPAHSGDSVGLRAHARKVCRPMGQQETGDRRRATGNRNPTAAAPGIDAMQRDSGADACPVRDGNRVGRSDARCRLPVSCLLLVREVGATPNRQNGGTVGTISGARCWPIRPSRYRVGTAVSSPARACRWLRGRQFVGRRSGEISEETVIYQVRERQLQVVLSVAR